MLLGHPPDVLELPRSIGCITPLARRLVHCPSVPSIARVTRARIPHSLHSPIWRRRSYPYYSSTASSQSHNSRWHSSSTHGRPFGARSTCMLWTGRATSASSGSPAGPSPCRDARMWQYRQFLVLALVIFLSTSFVLAFLLSADASGPSTIGSPSLNGHVLHIELLSKAAMVIMCPLVSDTPHFPRHCLPTTDVHLSRPNETRLLFLLRPATLLSTPNVDRG
ncbi:hypothetical protein C8J57DRAFT_554306 [Mycena rebaudengoi]|nr:hypothetical protein C8J57DRAFT_554306 [Mycena rebaudengoi]